MSRSVGATRARRADARRNERLICDAAMRVLAEHPAASMTQIAEACDLGRATLYRHFASREELVAAIQREALEAGAAALEAADLEEGSAVKALRRAIRALVGVGGRYRLLALEPSIDPAMLQEQPMVAPRLLALVQRGQRSGELRTDLPPQWIILTLANLLVLALRALTEEEITPEQAAERVASTLLDGLETSSAR